MISLEFMDRVEMFKDLSDRQLAEIGNVAESAEYKKGECIFKQGNPAEHLWIVTDGEVELRCGPVGSKVQKVQHERRDCVAFVSAAQAFGWTCFVPPYKYRLSGYCASRRCRLLKFNKADLEKLFENQPEIGFTVMQYTMTSVGTQFQELQDEIARQRGHEIINKW
ncbi:MAG: cyclic nucleotide-binding domain-containing protein [Desulfobacteraceae bacterium]|nr:cyclic nucleotide-binding domain-containing protein [Desulfobacteraceae bacterium]